jgi:hypothetical protein
MDFRFIPERKEMILDFNEFGYQRFFLAKHHQQSPPGQGWIGSLGCALIIKGLT